MVEVYPGMQVPFVKNSETSEAAADSMGDRTESLRRKILAEISKRPQTCDEIEELLHLRHQTASARICELHRMQMIRASGQTRSTRSGRKATVYMAVVSTFIQPSQAPIATA